MDFSLLWWFIFIYFFLAEFMVNFATFATFVSSFLFSISNFLSTTIMIFGDMPKMIISEFQLGYHRMCT